MVARRKKRGRGMDDNISGQVSFFDYFDKKPLNIKPKSLVEFINDTGVSQYAQIGNSVSKTVAYEKYEISEEAIGRITNNVSVCLLGIVMEYGKYMNGIIEGDEHER